MSFYGRMKREFYDRVDPELVMPESQRHFPEPGREAQYDRMLEDLGGADMCFGGLGINGHVAFNEAVDAGDPIAADEFANLGTRILPITRETRAINAFGYQRGDLMGMPELVHHHRHEADPGIPENLYCPEQTLAAWAAEACAS